MVEPSHNNFDQLDGSDEEYFDACEDINQSKSHLLSFLTFCYPDISDENMLNSGIECVFVRDSHFCFLYLSNENMPEAIITTVKFLHITYGSFLVVFKEFLPNHAFL